MEIKVVSVGGWQVPFVRETFMFPSALISEGRCLLERWIHLFPLEATWVRRECGVPSLIVRLDCVMQERRLRVYEVEERPAGIGLWCQCNPSFREQLKMVQETWPSFQVVLSTKRVGANEGDDYLWCQVVRTPSPSSLVLVRAEPDEIEYHSMEPYSVSSLKAKGDKSYGTGTLNLWKMVNVAQFDALPWVQGFVLKPTQGSKSRGVEIWDPERRPGCSTRSRIKATLAHYCNMYCQEFVPPMESSFPGYPWLMYRVFFGFNCSPRSWVCLGGGWLARNNLRIHGATDAICGPLVVPC